MMTSSLIVEQPVDLPVREKKSAPELRAGNPVPAADFSALKRRAILDGYKWDPQVGDISTLSPFPLILNSKTWAKISSQAELLATEAEAAEQEILRRPALLAQLGFPPALLRVLAAGESLTPAAGRVIRFDFHFTTRGWLISEANSDVPGGFSESSFFTGLMAEHFPELRPARSPAAAWADALAAATGSRARIALLSAPGYMEDHQVVSFLAAQLRTRGCRACLAQPAQILWRDGLASLKNGGQSVPLDALIKFYQAEWLARLPKNSGWQFFFCGGVTPVANPPAAVISESKRFPLVWDRLSTPLPTWRALLPETRDPRDAPWLRDDSWLLKTAFCNTGDDVCVRTTMKPRDWWRTALQVRWSPQNWLAQRRFESVPIPTPHGPRHVCVGVYTVNGRAAGAYARLSPKPVIDFAAEDAALLLEDDD